MYRLDESEIYRLKKVIDKFPQIKEIAEEFNNGGVKWAMAAGVAVYIYCGGDEGLLDDVDIWIASESKEKVAETLGQSWQSQSSERHKAENITFNNFDIFTGCRKFDNEKQVLDYQWTNLVDENLREAQIEDINYFIIAPEDTFLLKIANPREKDKEDIENLKKINLDNDYLQKRKIECNFEAYGNYNF